ncbi:MAG: efflux RND transporter periplasmic adaptor subunit [Chitinophagaceae bacterium]|nr:MAG: efflux RND transporter periplasmic adaptor subunit [Chitinophagaceae bacterium]
MQKTILSVLFFGLLFMVSCGSSETDKLENMQRELEEKREKFESLKIEIEQLETEIASLRQDTITTGRMVTLRPVEVSDFEHYIEAQGLVQADLNISLSAEMSGAVRNINVREGDYVRKGQLLVRQNEENIRNSIAEVESALELATTTYERQKNLWAENIGSEIQYLQAKNQKESLEKNLNTLNTQLNMLNIKSPIDGYIDEVFVKIGDVLSPGTPVVRIVNLENVYVRADVPERFLTSVKKGDNVKVRFPLINKEENAAISSVGQFINPGNRTFKIDIQLKNEEGLLKPNLLSVVRIMDYFSKDAIVIPTRLVQQYFDEEFVYVRKMDGQQSLAEKRNIVSGKTYGGITEILEGLTDEDMLIDAGFRDIADGQKIRVNK